jgi:hypothetical protein
MIRSARDSEAHAIKYKLCAPQGVYNQDNYRSCMLAAVGSEACSPVDNGGKPSFGKTNMYSPQLSGGVWSTL